MKAYFWKPDIDADCGIAVIADNYKEAKLLGSQYWGAEYGHESCDWFIEQRCKLLKGANIEGLPKGVVDIAEEGLKRGLYGYVEYSICPNCYDDDVTVYYDKEKGFYCCSCEDEVLNNKEIKEQ